MEKKTQHYENSKIGRLENRTDTSKKLIVLSESEASTMTSAHGIMVPTRWYLNIAKYKK